MKTAIEKSGSLVASLLRDPWNLRATAPVLSGPAITIAESRSPRPAFFDYGKLKPYQSPQVQVKPVTDVRDHERTRCTRDFLDRYSPFSCRSRVEHTPKNE